MSHQLRPDAGHTPGSVVLAYDEALANGDVPPRLGLTPENWTLEQKRAVQEKIHVLRLLEQNWPRNPTGDAKTSPFLDAADLLQELQHVSCVETDIRPQPTRESLRKAIVEDGFVFGAEFDAAVQRIGGLDTAAQRQEFAHDLVQRDVLNRHQASILCRGELPALVLQHFLILEEIGRGGMGVVYRALDRRRNQQVALKTVAAIRDSLLENLKHEFRAAADLLHPNLVVLDELWIVEGCPFYTMELVDGQSIDAYVRQDRASRPAGPTSVVKCGWRAGRHVAIG